MPSAESEWRSFTERQDWSDKGLLQQKQFKQESLFVERVAMKTNGTKKRKIRLKQFIQVLTIFITICLIVRV